ncbi:MAG TPA: glycosyltransferase family 4 protein [Stellaceae bacterium]|nr:glycosyltransferase family 4 protein [Stellaceae bacterium]
MHVAFYAPLKPPDHPVPSGDRRMARLLIAALARGGHSVTLASRLRSRDRDGDPKRQQRLAALGAALAARLVHRYRARPADRPDLWLTYHLYYKAPDWIGPRVAEGLGIPYVAAEASLAEKRLRGPWADGERAARAAVAQAAVVIGFNSADRTGVLPALADPTRFVAFAPFLERTPFDAAVAARAVTRARMAATWSLDSDAPWMMALAMMRDDVKLRSYQMLARALGALGERNFVLLVAGDGPARTEVEAAFAPLGRRVRFLGALAEKQVPGFLAAGDFFVWPALGEAYGMALLEAQAAGLPAVVGASGGVGDIVADHETGLLVPEGDVEGFAAAMAALLDDPSTCHRFSAAARRKVALAHDLDAAARRLDQVLGALLPAATQ